MVIFFLLSETYGLERLDLYPLQRNLKKDTSTLTLNHFSYKFEFYGTIFSLEQNVKASRGLSHRARENSKIIANRKNVDCCFSKCRACSLVSSASKTKAPPKKKNKKVEKRQSVAKMETIPVGAKAKSSLFKNWKSFSSDFDSHLANNENDGFQRAPCVSAAEKIGPTVTQNRFDSISNLVDKTVNDKTKNLETKPVSKTLRPNTEKKSNQTSKGYSPKTRKVGKSCSLGGNLEH